MADVDGWLIANAALSGCFIVPQMCIWLVSFCVVRHRDDSARRPFYWMKVAIPLYTLNEILNVLSDAIALVFNTLSFSDSWEAFEEVMYRSADASVFCENIAYIFLLLCMIDLGLSFLYVANQSKTGHTIVMSVTGGVTIILAALEGARFGKSETIYTDYFNSENTDSYFDYSQFNVPSDLLAAFDILFFLLALVVLALGIFVMVKCNGHPTLRNSAVIYLVTSILFLLPTTSWLAYVASFILPKPSAPVPQYMAVISPIFDSWPTFVIFVLLFVLGSRKGRGLWSTQQSWVATRDVNQLPPPPPQQQQYYEHPMEQNPKLSYQQEYIINEYTHEAPEVAAPRYPGTYAT